MEEEKEITPLTSEQRKAIQADKINVLRTEQLSGDEPEMIAANKDDKSKIRKDEVHLVHLKVSQKFHDEKAKKYNEKSKVIKLNVAQYQQMELERAFVIYDSTELVHDPRSKEQIAGFNKMLNERLKKSKPKTSKK